MKKAYLFFRAVKAHKGVGDAPYFLQDGRIQRLLRDQVNGKVYSFSAMEGVIDLVEGNFGKRLGSQDRNNVPRTDQLDLFSRTEK